ncbi:VOC family protein [Roseobacter sp. YSTF-M11]|uniref:VOC family protein n=1 Tax=Roseobacter insulae TaxID=2859783 RepID=A0A9X1FSF2_9RHOB|nr:VOC family protein [Roseobacter insulae]MBW4706865.1 VOC family protein [Roseobacter insulae]
MTSPVLGSLILYTSKIDEMAAFYRDHFGYVRHDVPGDRIVEMQPGDTGPALLLHKAAKGQRQGQSTVKLVFAVADVAAFCDDRSARGLTFGPLHQADGYVFANTKDPSGNSVSVSGRFANG